MPKKLHDQFETYLTSQGSRYTTQKRAIVSELFKTEDHFEIEEFLLSRYSRDEKLSRATVYRTVKQLLAAGLLQKITTQDGRVLYEQTMTQTQHDHLICNQCSKIFEIDSPQINDAIKTACQSIAFDPTYRSLHIYGICKDCQS